MSQYTDTDQNTEMYDCNVCSICGIRRFEVAMSCAGMHAYCFNCIKEWYISKRELSCPDCRKVCDSLIILPVDKTAISEELINFVNSIKIIKRGHTCSDMECYCDTKQFENTCIYPCWALTQYINNKEQLEFYYKAIKLPEYSVSDNKLQNLINWSTKISLAYKNEEFEHEYRVNATEPYFNMNYSRRRRPYEQNL